MLNINHNKNNKVSVEYNTKNGIKRVFKKVRPLKVIKTDNKGDFKDLKGNNYSLNDKTGEYLYTALYNKKYKSFNYYLNTILKLPEDFINELETPTFVFYDIETNGKGIPKKDKKTRKWSLNSEARINSIAWVNYQTKKEYCLIVGIHGSEEIIIKKFIKYCTDNKIMGLVGHNSFEFDNIFMIERLKAYGLDNELKLFYNDCNLDTMKLAALFKYTDDDYISLQDLSVNKLHFKEGKIDTGVYNPVTLYNKAITELKENNNKDLLNKFKKYNIQDVKLTMAVFDGMNCNEQLNSLFKQSLCPFNKMQYKSILLNSYICKEAFKNNIAIPESLNTQIEFENNGGYNYIEESETLNLYNNIIDFDIVSYYPNLLMLIGADNTYGYDNVDRETGEIKPFTNVPNGFYAKITKELFESRLRTKELRNKQPKGSDEYKRFDYEQKTKKIIVNSLYGLLTVEKANFILKNDLIGATITAIGRNVLKHIIENYNVVLAKTDSVFILKDGKEPEKLLKDINKSVTDYLSKKYNLNNVRNGNQLIKFEIDDDIINKLIVKDKSNYVKIIDGDYDYTGGSFKNIGFSEYENNLVNRIFKEFATTESNKKVIEYVKEYTEKVLKDCNNLQFFSKYIKLSDKQLNHYKMFGRFYMDNNNLPYSLNFKYLSCRVNGNEYDYIMYPKGHKPENLTINELYVYKMMIDTLKNCKIINDDVKDDLYKEYKIKKLEDKRNQIENKYKNNKDNESNIINKKDFESISNNNIKELDNIIPDTSLYYEKGLLTFIPVRAGTKKAYNISKLKYNEEHLSKLNINDLIEENDNFGVVVRYKNLQVFDIDGNKNLWKRLYHQEEWDNPKIKNKTIKLTDQEQEELQLLKDYIFNIFIKIDYPFIVQCSQSGGYHLLYTAPEPCNLNNIYYPEDLEITGIRDEILEEIRGKDFKDSIDINVNYIVFAPSSIDDKHQYKLYKNNYKWSNIFNNEITDIEERIDDTFKKAGFIVKERKYVNTTKEYKSKNKFKKENNISTNSELKKEFLEDTDLFNLLCEEFKNQTGKHNKILGVYTNILKYVGLSDSEAVNYMDRLLNIADPADYDEHIKQVKSYIDNNNGTKPNYRKHLKKKKLIQELNKYISKNEREKQLQEHITEICTFYRFKEEEQKYVADIIFNSDIFFYETGKDKPPKHTIFSILVFNLQELFKIKKTVTEPISYWFLNREDMIYIKIDEHKLQQILWKITKMNYNIADCKKILTTIVNTAKINDNYINCRNGLLNKKTGELENKEILFNELITDNLTFTTGQGEETLLNYIPDVQINNTDPNLLEKTLKEICIPKSEPENLKIYNDRLQRFGANLLGRKTKSIAYYYTNHQNSGKSGLRSIQSRLLTSAVVNPDIFNDNFYYNQIGNTKAILIDETQKGDLEEHLTEIKLISSPDTRQDQRVMYTDKTTRTKFGNLEIYTNYLINLNKNEIALFFRIDVIQLPNHFVETEKQMKKIENSYLVNESLFDNELLIENNIKDWEWLASASIQEYLKMEQNNKKFACRQSTEETMQILFKADPLTEFISKYVVETHETGITTTNMEIREKYKDFCACKGYIVNESVIALSQKLGNKLQDEFGKSVKSETRSNKGVKYFVKVKEIEEFEKECKLVYEIEEDLTEKQYSMLEKIKGDKRIVYNEIKKIKKATINDVSKMHPNINVTEKIKELENLGLIYNTFQQKII